MTHPKPQTGKLASFATSFVALTFIVAALLHIVATPDDGGIWDGYVPKWLGGEGPESVKP